MGSVWIQTDALRTQVRERLAQSSDTLIRFAEHIGGGRGIPLNTWRQVDRPLGREATSLGSAFDVWHAMLRAERALRGFQDPAAEKLRNEARKLQKTLESFTQERAVTSDRGPQARLLQTAIYARQLTSDDIFGTFNGLTAASILRSEIFPERSAATPSYLAGHIIICELKIAAEQAKSSSAMAIRERSPRLAVAAEGVHSLMLYVEHLEARARLFKALATDIVLLHDLNDVASEDSVALKAVNAYGRVVMTRMAARSSDCGSLLLATRTFFDALSKALQERVDLPDTPTVADLDKVVELSAGTLTKVSFEAQRRIHDTVFEFCSDLHIKISAVHQKLDTLLTGDTPSSVVLTKRLTDLRNALSDLECVHAGGVETGQTPSIGDAARFQFAKMIVDQFWDTAAPHDFKFPLAKPLLDKINALRRTYLNDTSPSPGDLPDTASFQDLHGTLRALGKSPVGKSVLLWWRKYAECYSLSAEDPGYWINLRHKSLKCIETFTAEAMNATNSRHLSKCLETAGLQMATLAREIGTMVQSLTAWCLPRGYRLLQAERPDPHELASALWIADRTGEPWADRLEQAAFDILAAAQRADGGFPATAPLFHYRGFMFQVPSASTISILARFVTAGTAAPVEERSRKRLLRWKPILEKGARFLVDGMVGQEESRGFATAHSRGWHSDRHPEADRVDCHATTEAVTALCRLDDALLWLTNLEAMHGFRVSWPNAAPQDTLPTDCGSEFLGSEPREGRRLPQMQAIAQFVHHQKQRVSLYTRNFEALGPNRNQHVFMLYGPPGTGKTHFQSLAAGELRWPMLTLTIGDFLYEGEDRVGKRADDIFRRLHFLSKVGIVFDEFDEMVADRDSRGQAHPGFPLLTAAMLPLLAELRDHARRAGCLVSFTTNFIDNIDQAAKRVGRIDKKLLVVYPDFQFRLLYGMSQMLRGSVRRGDTLAHMKRAAVRSGVCSYPDITDYIEAMLASDRPEDPANDPEPPILAITVDYYEKLLNDGTTASDDELVRSVNEIRTSIGDATVVAEWLERHEDWKKLFDMANPSWRSEGSTTSARKIMRGTGGSEKPGVRPAKRATAAPARKSGRLKPR